VAKRGERDRERGRRDGATRLAAETGGRRSLRRPLPSVRCSSLWKGTSHRDRPRRGGDRPDARGDDRRDRRRRDRVGRRIRWQVNVVVTGESSESDESSKSGESSGSGGTEAPPAVDRIRAGDRLVAAVAGSELVALDAETGERAFSVTEAWPDGGGAADRVAVDGEGVWVAVESEGEGEVDGGSEEPVATLVRFGPSGERRAERSVSVDVDWLVAVDETLVVGSAAGNGEGFDADLDRRFALSVPTPSDRPPVVEVADGAGGPDGNGPTRRISTSVGAERSGGARHRRRRGRVEADRRADSPAARRRRRRALRGPIASGPRRRRRRRTAGGRRSESVTVDELFAVGGHVIVVDGGELYGLRATPGERWSLVG